MAATEEQLAAAMWAGDEKKLWELAPCRCCCDEHSFAWGGCRGQGSAEWPEEEASWMRHYEEMHGMTREQFYAY